MIPLLVLDAVRALRPRGIRFTGDYSSWAEASADAQGYDNLGILSRVREAMLKVKCGEACFERDGVVFFHPLPNLPLLTALLGTALAHDGYLRVMDFGGALGGTYYQAQPYLQSLKKLEWCVVEQPHYVECGRREFQTATLQFFSTIEECVEAGKPHVALFSSVLQYLPDPQAILRKVVEARIEDVVIDRTPFLCSGHTRLAVQRVPAALGGASYPVWLFGEQELGAALGTVYRCVFEFTALDGKLGQGRNTAEFKGFYFSRELE
jgi:putative methyltransferase (TIGR04325 family)